jgi:hypothetical protein
MDDGRYVLVMVAPRDGDCDWREFYVPEADGPPPGYASYEAFRRDCDACDGDDAERRIEAVFAEWRSPRSGVIEKDAAFGVVGAFPADVALPAPVKAVVARHALSWCP